jgi:hypothetical protein
MFQCNIEFKGNVKYKALLNNIEFCKNHVVSTGWLDHFTNHPKGKATAPEIAYYMAKRHAGWHAIYFTFGTPQRPTLVTRLAMERSVKYLFGALQPRSKVGFKILEDMTKAGLKKGIGAINSPIVSVKWAKKKGFYNPWKWTGFMKRMVDSQTTKNHFGVF